jgi:hypothetical protein
MLFVQGQCTLTESQLDFFQHVLSSDFPWFYKKEKNHDESTFWFFVHALMHPDEEFNPIAGTINSPFYDICIDIFKSFCAEHNIEVNTIFRAALNSTLHSPYGRTRIHKDHRFEHKNFLLYVNEFTDGQTLIFDEHDNVVQQSEPQLHKAIVFSGEPHAHNFCSVNQRRIVLVVTFD